MAIEAAKAVKGIMLLPTFAPNEQSENPRKFSDFNDLAKHSRLGVEGIKRQFKTKIETFIKKRNQPRHSRQDNVIHIA